MLVLALGDGIRAEAEALAGLLQKHARAHFTFALVELTTHRHGSTGEILVVPNTLAQTVMIERGIVIVENGRAIMRPMPPTATPQAQSLTAAIYYEMLGAKAPTLPEAVKRVLAIVEPLGVYPELKAALNLKAGVAEVAKRCCQSNANSSPHDALSRGAGVFRP